MPEQTPPLVFSRREANTQRIAALEARADRLNLKPGMGVAEARAIHPEIEVIEADPEADQRLLHSLADWCDRYTPLVAIDGDQGLFLDITGCAHLFGGEHAMLDDLLGRLFHQGFEARAALAASPGAAWALARFGHAPGIVEAGDEAGTIAPLPLAALRIGQETVAGLASVGLRSIGAIMNLPRAPLARRFGRQMILRLDQALGRVEEPISPRLPVPVLSAERIFAEPITQIEDVEALLETLAGRLQPGLERRGEGATRLQLALFRVDGEVIRISVGASRPVRVPSRIGLLLRERLGALEGRLQTGYGYDLVRLSVLVAAPFPTEQTDLHGSSADSEGDLAHFTDRVRARLGSGAILRPRMIDSHWPEKAARLLPESPDSRPTSPAAPLAFGQERPIRLLARPECVEVSAAEVPEGPPMHFRWRRASYRVVRAEGPERIAPEWWQEEAGDTRDYFRIEDEEGRRYWMFREGAYGAESPPRWYLQGLFA